MFDLNSLIPPDSPFFSPHRRRNARRQTAFLVPSVVSPICHRAVQLEAGIIGGKIYLTAYAQYLGATGLTFYDDDVVSFF
jgi:hypothetical protein